jgi:hypothetical protein
MKHILNNLSNEEKNSIREQHTGGMKVITENFSKLLNSKLGDSKPLVEMEEMPEGMFSRELSKTDKLKRDINDAISRKIASPKTTGVSGKWSYGEEEKSMEQILNDIEDVVSRYRGEESESFVSEQSFVDSMSKTKDRIMGDNPKGWDVIKSKLMRYRPIVDNPNLGNRLLGGESSQTLTFKDLSSDSNLSYNPSLIVDSSMNLTFVVLKSDKNNINKFKTITKQNGVTPKWDGTQNRGGIITYTVKANDFQSLLKLTIDILNSFGKS